MTKPIAIYMRVSTVGQDTASQEPELDAWAEGQKAKILRLSEKVSGRAAVRPEWDKLYQMILKREISQLVVWRLDRLGRTASQLTKLFDELQIAGINLVSLKDGIDLSTPAGRLMAGVLASVAQFETEVRQERILAGIAAAKKAGKRWGGKKPGVRHKVTKEQMKIISTLNSQGISKAKISRLLSRSMNPTLKQSIIDEAMAEDPAAARSEYMGEFRDDIAEFMSTSMIEQLIIDGRLELSPDRNTRYFAFADISGGRGDDAAIAIAHKQDDKVVLDLLKRYRPPFSPQQVIGDMAKVLKRYRLKGAMGDNYAAEFTAAAFRDHGMKYRRCKESKSILYAELIPHICSQQLELLDAPDLVKQISSLERRTRSGGRDQIDHPPGGHDDLANVLAGVVHYACSRRFRLTQAL